VCFKAFYGFFLFDCVYAYLLVQFLYLFGYNIHILIYYQNEITNGARNMTFHATWKNLIAGQSGRLRSNVPIFLLTGEAHAFSKKASVTNVMPNAVEPRELAFSRVWALLHVKTRSGVF